MADSVEVLALPNCDLRGYFCTKPYVHPAEYDFRTDMGWANGCKEAFQNANGKLGTGNGQRLIVSE